MKDSRETREQLIGELAQARQQIAELERLAKEGEKETMLASETRYRRLFESAQDGILILDGDTGQIADANAFLVEMLGYDREELLGKTLWEIGPFKDTKASKKAFRQLLHKKYVRYEHLPLETKDGHRTSVEFVSNVYLVDGKTVIQCNIRDISARVRTEVESAEYKDRLRDW